jgi:hypothetical protein
LASITAEEYRELIELSEVEPIGMDAIIYQLAVVAQAMAGGKLKDFIVLCNEYEMTPEQIARSLGWQR